MAYRDSAFEEEDLKKKNDFHGNRSKNDIVIWREWGERITIDLYSVQALAFL